MVEITESDVYFTLSYHVWKTPKEINNDIRQKKGKKVGFEKKSALKTGLAVLFTDSIIPPTKLFIHLNSLVVQGFAEYRERRPAEISKKYDIPSEREYHLTSNGIKNKSKYTKEENEGLEGCLQPSYLVKD
ncbi:hypothetical protein KY342_05315 [Candidatus Woesearchaeota archaeon]|nr:hypothetical protein [Candidatus Woesearchaeota archaeon]